MQLKNLLLASVAIAVTLGLIREASADLIVSESRYGIHGYGLSDWSIMTEYLNSAFGGAENVTTVVNLENRDQVLAADALWIDVRDYLERTPMTDVERTNIADFIATGKKVVMIGGGGSWGTWNDELLGLVGEDYPSTGVSGYSEPVVENELTAGVDRVQYTGGTFLGGTALFRQSEFGLNSTALFGETQNVLVTLSYGQFDDERIDPPSGSNFAQNDEFAQNLAAWVALEPAAVPEPGSFVLLGLAGAGGLAGGAIRRRRRARC